MRKYITLAGLFLCMAFCMTGCQKDYYGKGKKFTLSIDAFPGYSNEEIGALSADNYERFLHASYIIVTDKYGETQKVKISANIKRHEWDWSNLDTSTNYKRYVDANGQSGKVGIDVSEHQGTIDWAKVATAVDFAFVRLGYRGYGTEGRLILDGFYAANMKGANENHLPVGVYFYSQATTYDEGVAEANFVLQNLGGYTLDYPIVLDREDPMVEDARTNNLSVEQHTQAALGFLETIRAAGYQTMMYTNRMYYALYLNLDTIYQYPIWYAQYADEPDWPYEFNIWQYTESGEVPGISGPVDLNLQMKEIQ